MGFTPRKPAGHFHGFLLNTFLFFLLSSLQGLPNLGSIKSSEFWKHGSFPLHVCSDVQRTSVLFWSSLLKSRVKEDSSRLRWHLFSMRVWSCSSLNWTWSCAHPAVVQAAAAPPPEWTGQTSVSGWISLQSVEWSWSQWPCRRPSCQRHRAPLWRCIWWRRRSDQLSSQRSARKCLTPPCLAPPLLKGQQKGGKNLSSVCSSDSAWHTYQRLSAGHSAPPGAPPLALGAGWRPRLQSAGLKQAFEQISDVGTERTFAWSTHRHKEGLLFVLGHVHHQQLNQTQRHHWQTNPAYYHKDMMSGAESLSESVSSCSHCIHLMFCFSCCRSNLWMENRRFRSRSACPCVEVGQDTAFGSTAIGVWLSVNGWMGL